MPEVRFSTDQSVTTHQNIAVLGFQSPRMKKKRNLNSFVDLSILERH